MSLFEKISDPPVDPIFGLSALYKKDNRPFKVDLIVGVCPEECGAPPRVWDAVKRAEERLLGQEKTKNYLPIDGDAEYLALTGKLIFGDLYRHSIYGAQTVGGTSALRLAADFIKQELTSRISISDPTWANHTQIFERVGFEIDRYPYWGKGGFDFQKMVDHIKKLPPKTAVLLQPVAHNPTGADLSLEQWRQLSQVFHEKSLIPFFDSAYQGFAEGLDEDAEPMRLFVRDGHEIIVTHSYSKSMALYNERLGALYIVMKDDKMVEQMQRLIRSLIRTDYSNPPSHGSSIAKIILSDATLYKSWLQDLTSNRERIHSTRGALASKLGLRMPTRSFDTIRSGHGFFTLLDLDKAGVIHLRDAFAIYLTGSARLSIAGLNTSNMDRVVEAITEVMSVEL